MELKSAADERMKELKEAFAATDELEKILPEFYLGQGAVYVIEEQHMVVQHDALVENGPSFTLHPWNARPTRQSNIDAFYKDTNDGKLLDPFNQVHAMVFAVSRSLVDPAALGKVKSGRFPDVVFKSNKGTIEVVAGHHRMKVLAKSNEELLKYKIKCEDIVNTANQAQASSASSMELARSGLADISQKLWLNGRWGVIFLDLGKLSLKGLNICTFDIYPKYFQRKC